MTDQGSFKLGANVQPNWVKWETRPDGAVDVLYGLQGVEPHAHTVVAPNGQIDYARTIGQNIKIDRSR